MKQTKTSVEGRIDNLALTREARQAQLIAKAERLAEKKLEDGTASPQIIVHYLRLATAREEKELAILEQKQKLMTAQTEAIESAQRIESLYEDAMNMFKKYNGDVSEDGDTYD